jgi:hypothetical protein
MWRMAVGGLRYTSGRHDHVLYLDPVANLAGQMIAVSEFSQAEELLRTAWNWWRGSSPGILVDYPEFGWWYLYNGKVEEARKHILALYRSRAPDEASLAWLTLATWLCGDFRECASKLGHFHLTLTESGLPTALNACVVATACPPGLADSLMGIVYRKHEPELSNIAVELGLRPPTLKPPLAAAVCKTVIRSLDMKVTGGKYYGAIG